MRRRRIHRVVAVLAAMGLGWVAAVVAPSSTVRASITDDPTSVSTTVSSTTSTTLPGTGIGEVDATVTGVQGTVSGAVGEVETVTGPVLGGEDEDPGGDEGEPPPEPEPAPEPPKEDPPAQERGAPAGKHEPRSPAKEAAGPRTGDESQGSDDPAAPQSVELALDYTRYLGGLPQAEPISLGSLLPVPLPAGMVDLIDVPLGPRSSRDVVDRLEEAGHGPDRIAEILAPFPVAGPATYSNDWGAPRLVPTPHRHEGTDVFATRGTPVVASGDGTVTRVGIDTAIGGNSVWLEADTGTLYYYAHLDVIAAGIKVGVRVTQGESLGTVGTSGNAAGGLPHLHFEVHPDGAGPVPPLPHLDRWLLEARHEADALLGGTSAVASTAPAPAAPAPADSPVVRQAEFVKPALTSETSPATAWLLLFFALAVAAGLVRHHFLRGFDLPKLLRLRVPRRLAPNRLAPSRLAPDRAVVASRKFDVPERPARVNLVNAYVRLKSEQVESRT